MVAAWRTGRRGRTPGGVVWTTAVAAALGLAAAAVADPASPPPARPENLALAAAVAPNAPAPAVQPQERPTALPGPEADAGGETADGVTGAAAEAGTGPVTGLPMPRFVSLRSSEGNARRGPALSHRVDWVFTRRDMPLKVTAEFGHWRRVEDAEGAGGWMHFALLSGVRTALVTQEMTAMHLQPDPRAPVVAWLEAGVVARVLACEGDWCRLRADRLRGWAPRAALWGVGPQERFE